MASSPAIRQLTIVVATLFASFSAGAGMGFPSILLYQLRRNDTEIRIEDLDTSSWIGSIHGLAGIPAIIAPVIMQWRGRKFTFIAGCLTVIIGWIIAYVANSIGMILMSESLHGFGANILLTVSFDCLSEMITPTYRNNAVLSYSTINILGLVMPGIFMTFAHWRSICIIMGLPAIIGLIISYFWLESPLWLAYKDNLEQSKVNFYKLRGTDDLSVKEWQEVLAANKERVNKKRSLKGDTFFKHFLRQIFSRDFLLPALHVYLLLNNVYWSGTTVVLLYSMELISKSTQNETAVFIGSIVINFSLVLGSTVSNILMKFYNNKPILLYSTSVATACLFTLSIVTYLQSLGFFHEKTFITLYLLVGYMISASLGQSAVGYTVSAELMPVKHRGIGGALFVIYACSLHATTLKISPYLFMYIGLWGTFLVYASNSIVCGLLIWKYVPETKGKTLQEIENFYTNGTFEIKLLDDEKEPMNINNL